MQRLTAGEPFFLFTDEAAIFDHLKKSAMNYKKITAKRGILVRNTDNISRDFGEVDKWAGKVIIKIDGKDRTIFFTEASLAAHLKQSDDNPEDALKLRRW